MQTPFNEALAGGFGSWSLNEFRAGLCQVMYGESAQVMEA
jgi:hypothetical protein